jgi:hypothetical protein
MPSTTRDDWDTVGMRGTQSRTTELHGRGPRRPRRAPRRPGPNPDPIVFGIFSVFEVLLASVYTGVARRARPRRRGGEDATSKKTGRPYSDDPDIRWRIAEMALAYDGLLPRSRRSPPTSTRSRSRRLWFAKLSGLKHRAVVAAKQIVDEAMLVAGGSSYFTRNELSRLYRDVLAGMFHPPTPSRRTRPSPPRGSARQLLTPSASGCASRSVQNRTARDAARHAARIRRTRRVAATALRFGDRRMPRSARLEVVRLEEFGDGELALIAALGEHVRDVGAQMVLDQQLVEGCERLLDRTGLGDDVHAVVLVLDHLREPAHLTLEDAGAVQGALLDVVDHAARIRRMRDYGHGAPPPNCSAPPIRSVAARCAS